MRCVSKPVVYLCLQVKSPRCPHGWPVAASDSSEVELIPMESHPCVPNEYNSFSRREYLV